MAKAETDLGLKPLSISIDLKLKNFSVHLRASVRGWFLKAISHGDTEHHREQQHAKDGFRFTPKQHLDFKAFL